MILAIGAAIASSGEPLPKVFVGSVAGKMLLALSWKNSLIFVISSSYMGSYIFYILVVWWPERQRKTRILNQFVSMYEEYRSDSIAVFLSFLGTSYEYDLPNRLLNPSEFKEFFKTQHSADQDRWQVVQDGLDEITIRKLNVFLWIFRGEVNYVLNSIEIKDAESLEKLKNFTTISTKMIETTFDYDEIDRYSGRLWEIFAGWSWSEAYQNDFVLQLVKELR